MNAGEREELARLLPPVEHDLPEGRHRLLKEFVMTETQAAARPRRLTRPAVLVPVLAAAAALAVAVPTFLGSGDPAYAIADNPDGTVSITVNEMRDPEALEADLKGRGYNIEVDYVPVGKQCSPRERSQSWAEEEDAFSPWPPPSPSKEPRIVIDPSALKAGQTGVLMFGIIEPPTGGMVIGANIRVSNGPVAECVLVDSDGAPLGGGS